MELMLVVLLRSLLSTVTTKAFLKASAQAPTYDLLRSKVLCSPGSATSAQTIGRASRIATTRPYLRCLMN